MIAGQGRRLDVGYVRATLGSLEVALGQTDLLPRSNQRSAERRRRDAGRAVALAAFGTRQTLRVLRSVELLRAERNDIKRP